MYIYVIKIIITVSIKELLQSINRVVSNESFFSPNELENFQSLLKLLKSKSGNVEVLWKCKDFLNLMDHIESKVKHHRDKTLSDHFGEISAFIREKKALHSELNKLLDIKKLLKQFEKEGDLIRGLSDEDIVRQYPKYSLSKIKTKRERFAQMKRNGTNLELWTTAGWVHVLRVLAQHTGCTGDFGMDVSIFALDDNYNATDELDWALLQTNIKIIPTQCKLRPQDNVCIGAARQLQKAIEKYKAPFGILYTNKFVTSGVRDFVKNYKKYIAVVDESVMIAMYCNNKDNVLNDVEREYNHMTEVGVLLDVQILNSKEKRQRNKNKSENQTDQGF